MLVSVLAAHNEIGVIQPLAEIGALCRAKGILFHSDAAQAAGKIPLDVEAMQIDLMSISGHKMYGPKGVGVLYVRRRPRVRLLPLIDGGGQERGLRSGTLPTPLCVGLGRAAAIAGAEMAEEAARLRRLRDRLHQGLARRVAGLGLNGDRERRLAGNLNLSFPGLSAPALIDGLPGDRDLDRLGLHLGRRSSRPMCCARSGFPMRSPIPRSASASAASTPRRRSISRSTRWPRRLPGSPPRTGCARLRALPT